MEYCNECKKTRHYYGILYAGIAMNVEKLATIMGSYMQVLQWM
jgi:hypothetical protein